MKRVRLADLKAQEPQCHGIVQRAFAAGRLLPGNVEFELPDDFDPVEAPVVAAAPVPEPTPEEPTVAELATNFTVAVAKWAASGFKVVDGATYAARSAACAGCEHWSDTARLGLGKCSAPGCGCTRLKRWLATERCPLGKWRE